MTNKQHSAERYGGVLDTRVDDDVESRAACSTSLGITTLKQICEQRWREMKLSAQKLSSTSSQPVNADHSLLQILQEKEKCLQAEITVLKATKPDSLPAHPEVQFEVLKQDCLSSIEQLEQTLSLAGSQEKELKNSIDREEEYQRQLLTINGHLKNKVERLQGETMSTTRDPLSIVFKELQSKLEKMENVDEQLSTDFNQILSEHFPLPKENDVNVYKKKLRLSSGSHGNRAHRLFSLKTILEELMNKCIDEPHDPYITVNDLHWPPYIELLSRCNIVLTHPDHDNQIKLVPFHM